MSLFLTFLTHKKNTHGSGTGAALRLIKPEFSDTIKKDFAEFSETIKKRMD
jgi:hypothetical protein